MACPFADSLAVVAREESGAFAAGELSGNPRGRGADHQERTAAGATTSHPLTAPNPPRDFRTAKALALAQFEIAYLDQVLTAARGNVSEAARIAGKERRALGKLLKKHRIDRAAYDA